MPITTISSREFNQDTSGAKKAAQKGPVFITDRGRPAHVLLTIEDYQKLTGGHATIVDLLAMPEAGDIDFEAPRLAVGPHRPADFSCCTCSTRTSSRNCARRSHAGQTQ